MNEPQTGHAGSRDRLWDLVMLGSLLLIACFKIMIVWGNEIVPEGSDSFLYMQYAKFWFWGTGHFPFRGPGYPLWISISQALGLPLRLTTEALFLASAAAFTISLRILGLPFLAAVAVYVGVVFYPDTFYVFDQPMSEGFFACLALLCFSCLFLFLRAEGIGRMLLWSVGMGILLGFMVDTRGNDIALIYAFCAFAIAAKLGTSLWLAGRRGFTKALIASAVSLAALGAVHLSVLTANYVAFGLFQINEIVSGGEQSLLHALMRIDTGEPELHGFISVTNKARLRAYELSPTLRTYESAIEGEFKSRQEESAYTSFSRTGVAGQFDTQATIMALDEVVVPAPPPSGWSEIEAATARDELHYRIASEIDTALSQERAPSRLIVYIWNPLSMDLYVNAAHSAARLVGEMFRGKSPPKLDNYPFYGSLVAPLYDEVAGRRAWAVRKGPLEGYLAVDMSDEIAEVRFRNDTEAFFASQGAAGYYDQKIAEFRRMGFETYEDMGNGSLSRIPLSELPAEWKPVVPPGRQFYRFTVDPVDDRFHLDFGRLDLKLKSGSSTSIRQLSLLKPMISEDGFVETYLTRFEPALTDWQRWGYTWQETVFRMFNQSIHLVCLLALVVAVAYGSLSSSLMRGCAPFRIRMFAAAAMVGVFILMRIGLYSVMDVTIMPLNDSRHLFAANVFAVPAVVLFLFLVSLTIAGARSIRGDFGLEKEHI